MDGAHVAPDAGTPAPPPAPPADVPPLASGGGGSYAVSFFRRLPTELLSRVLGRVGLMDRMSLRLCDRDTRDALDARGWGQRKARGGTPALPPARARARSGRKQHVQKRPH